MTGFDQDALIAEVLHDAIIELERELGVAQKAYDSALRELEGAETYVKATKEFRDHLQDKIEAIRGELG